MFLMVCVLLAECLRHALHLLFRCITIVGIEIKILHNSLSELLKYNWRICHLLITLFTPAIDLYVTLVQININQ